MRNVIVGSFVGFLLAAALLAACGGSGGDSDPAVAELVLKVEALEQELATLKADQQTQADGLAQHEADADAHHVPSDETPWLGLNWCIALQGIFPSRSLQLPGDPGTEISADPALGAITCFAGDFAPRGWALCNGQLLNISSNTALYSILGLTYGGDGLTTFALPDLRGRVPMHAGAGPNGTVGLAEKGP